MLAMMLRHGVPVLLAGLGAIATTTAQRTLADVQRQFLTESQRLYASSPDETQRSQLLSRHIAELGRFVANEAKGDDRWNGRLMLADLELVRGQDRAAVAALKQIDGDAAPALLLVTAATMAQRLELTDQRAQWIRQALAKPATVEERLAMARLLLTVLREVDAGETIFRDTLAAATDDEQRAYLRWYRADAMRDREDLPDNAGFEALEQLAKDLPATYWGSVAKDRLRATMLRVGDAAIPCRGKALDGTEIDSSKLAGKAIALVFWSGGDQDLPRLLALLQAQRKRLGDKLALVGICLDREAAAIGPTAKGLGIDFPVLGDGKGPLQDAALRWFVEGPQVHVIDAAGKVAGLGLHAGTADGRSELEEVLARAAGG
jgi:hypothetical protein